MGKEQSLQLKGLAILMMLWLHLFNTVERVGECVTMVNYFNGKPLAYVLARCSGMCVPIYLLISGYGMAKARDLGSKATRRRLWRVYSRLWLVFVIFIPLGCWLRPEQYPGSWSTALLNLLGLDVSYNGEWWFLFPWCILMVSARWIVPFVQRHGAKVNAAVFLGLYLLCIGYKWPTYVLGANVLSAQLQNLFLVMPAFYVGVCFGSHTDRWRRICPPHPLWLIVVLYAVRALIGASLVNVLFAVPLILLFIQARLPHWAEATLRFFGKYSVFIWLTHTFYAYYFFHDELYGLCYPLPMYVTLVVVSLLTAMLLYRLYNLLSNLLRRP
ncbi:MAG: acyltransferase [Bacteroidaceae bacterium]|nr:acyltransferase [Bacteroidaceae bacterium]